jgi:hypothetical protein
VGLVQVKSGSPVWTNAVPCTNTVVATTGVTTVSCTVPVPRGSPVTPYVLLTDGPRVLNVSTRFVVPVPTITSIVTTARDTSQLSQPGGLITIDGDNLGVGAAVSTVAVNKNGVLYGACTGVTRLPNGDLTCTAPAGTGTGYVVVVTVDGLVGLDFTVDYASPEVDVVQPGFSYSLAGYSRTVTLLGYGFGNSAGRPEGRYNRRHRVHDVRAR